MTEVADRADGSAGQCERAAPSAVPRIFPRRGRVDEPSQLEA
jgi:hypothetical protein